MFWKKIREALSNKNKNVRPCYGHYPRILAIEDEATQRAMIKKTLEKNGYQVFLAEDGEKGIELARAQKPDLILLDVILPGIDGQEVCKRLKADTDTQQIPIIFLTSVNTPASIIEHFDLGAEIHLAKPIGAKELISQVEITLRGRRS